MTDRYKTKKYVNLAIILLVLSILLGYTGYEIQKVFYGPTIKVDSPQNGALVSNSLLEIKGMAQNINNISLNDKKIFIDEKGNFNEKILLSYGYNVLKLEANDKFGRQTEKILEVIYK
jgi:hypothetical protein